MKHICRGAAMSDCLTGRRWRESVLGYRPRQLIRAKWTDRCRQERKIWGESQRHKKTKQKENHWGDGKEHYKWIFRCWSRLVRLMRIWMEFFSLWASWEPGHRGGDKTADTKPDRVLSNNSPAIKIIMFNTLMKKQRGRTKQLSLLYFRLRNGW